MPNLLFTIGDMARLAGITPKTLRHYHEIGLLPEPVRDANRYRLYSIDQLERLQLILRLKGFGLSLQQIQMIFEAENPDDLVRVVLQKHEQRIQGEIQALQRQLGDIQSYLASGVSLQSDWQESSPQHSALSIVRDTLRPRSNGLSDVLAEVDGAVLARLDRYAWAEGYDLFWHQVSRYLLAQVLHEESLFIFWLERYLALGAMDEDDLQGMAWINELAQSPVRALFAKAFRPPQIPAFAEKDQAQIQRLLPALLYQDATVLQKEFLKAILTK